MATLSWFNSPPNPWSRFRQDIGYDPSYDMIESFFGWLADFLRTTPRVHVFLQRMIVDGTDTNKTPPSATY